MSVSFYLYHNCSVTGDRPNYIFDNKVQPHIQWDGVVEWVPSTLLESSCTIDLVNYPFDTQT